MKIHFKISMLILSLGLVASPLLAGEGKALYEKSCTRCHSTEVFTRDDRDIKSLEGLKKQVKQCSIAAESQWGDGEIDTVAEYLNKSFYKF